MPKRVTPQARQLQYEADLAAAGYRDDEYGLPIGASRHGLGCQCPYCYDEPDEEPPVAEYDSGLEADEAACRSTDTSCPRTTSEASHERL
jgi:hypothetical protein